MCKISYKKFLSSESFCSRKTLPFKHRLLTINLLAMYYYFSAIYWKNCILSFHLRKVFFIIYIIITWVFIETKLFIFVLFASSAIILTTSSFIKRKIKRDE